MNEKKVHDAESPSGGMQMLSVAHMAGHFLSALMKERFRTLVKECKSSSWLHESQEATVATCNSTGVSLVLSVINYMMNKK